MNEQNFKYKILFSCGDRSADNYLSLILKNLQVLSPNVKNIVLGGEKSKNFATLFIEDLVSYDAHGFFSPFRLIFKFLKILKSVEKILKEGIDAVVLIDYYGLNIRIAKLAKKYNTKVIYYIVPQVWATRRYRIKKIKKYVDYVITIYPFEKDLFMKNNIKAYYWGHPIFDIISLKNVSTDENLKERIIGLFPGSRKQVINWNLPQMLKVIKFYLNNYSKEQKFYIFGFEKYDELYKKLCRKFLGDNWENNIKLVYNNEFRDKIFLAISVSGTNLLENVVYRIPTIVVYKLPMLMYFLIKKLIYIKTISLPNIILGKKIIPEFIQSIDPKKVCDKIYCFINNKQERETLLLQYEKIINLLSEKNNISYTITKEILEFVYGKS